jgi:periplasmic divalent cation tolerance protein
MSTNVMIFFVTCPNFENAEILSKDLVEKNLAACANIFPGIISIYRWKGKIETDHECFVILKSTSENREKIYDFIKKNHPYENPECVGFTIEDGLPLYLQWIIDSVK